MKVGELVRAIDAVVPLSGAGTWDAVGLQVGDPQREAGAVGVCHEVSADVVEVCHQAGIGTLVTYHPLLFRPTRTFLAGPDAGGKAMALAKQDVSVISIHTAFDVARPGTADAYGAAIGGTLVGTFAPVDDEGGAGIGRVFALSAPQTFDDFTERVALATPGGTPRDRWRRASPATMTTVSTYAVVPGSGGSFTADAVGRTDCLVTGDVGHHDAVYAVTHGLAVLDVGHPTSELRGVEALYALVATLVSDVVAVGGNPDPWMGST